MLGKFLIEKAANSVSASSNWRHFFDALAGAVRSFIGVGSDTTRKKDLEQVSPWMMIGAGVFLLLVFLVSVYLIVSQVVPSQ